MKRILLLSSAFALFGSVSFAAVTAESLAADYLALGYRSIEVVSGPTQIKVEASGPTGRTEVIYDAATGTVLKQESGRAEAGDDNSAGVEMRQRQRDFVKVRKARRHSASGNDDGAGHDAGDDHGDDGAGHDAGDDHGGDDDDSGDDHGGDDHGGDDHGGDDDDSGDDHGGDDHGGKHGSDD